MAFNTGASLDSILLRGLNFRYPNNAPVSSFYSLYANGAGQTYWSNAITSDNLSTLSTSLSVQYSTLSGFISTNNAVNIQQTSNISTLYGAQFSSVNQLLSNDAGLSNSLNVLNNQFVTNSNQTKNTFLNYDAQINSSLNAAVGSASSYGPVYSSINSLAISTQSSIFGLSSIIVSQNTSTYLSLTANYKSYTNTVIVSTVSSINYQISSINTKISSIVQLNTFASTIQGQLVSTSVNLSRQISSLSTYTISTINSLSTHTNLNLLSSTSSLIRRVSSLEGLSTNLSSITYKWISSFYSTNIYYNNSTTYSYINRNSNAISTINKNLATVAGQASTTSTFVNALYLSDKSTNTSLTNQVSDLWFAYSTLSASSILVNIWSSFYNLEVYTSSVIGQRYSSITQYENNVYQSTITQNTSTSAGYFNFYVSTLYASTLSTLIPSTIAFTSSMVSTLYSTQYYYMTSTLNSSMTAIQSSYTSTMFGLQSSFIASTQYQVNSTLTGAITIAGVSTYSTIAYQTTSTFTFITNANATQSNIFYSTQASYISSYNILFASTVSTNNLASTTLGQAVFANTTLIVSTNQLFTQQLSAQSSQYASTIVTYNALLTAQANSAYSFVVNSTVGAVNVAASNVTVSTINTYNAFVASLCNQTGSIGVSTLYTNINLFLQGSTYTQTMDLITYRNFYIQVSSINNGGSNYRLTYNSNSLSILGYRRGVISIDINTVGQAYTNNGGQLRLDFNILGVPTSVWKNVYPYISNADYLAQYEYTIINNTMWTNLLGLYPRVQVKNPYISSIIPSVQWSNAGIVTYDPSTILRGGPVSVSWSNYSFFPYASIGEVPFEPQIVIETYVGATLYNEYGPYPFSQSTASINAPYILGAGGIQTATVNMYILGYPNQPSKTTFKVLQPSFDSITIQNANYGLNAGSNSYVGGYELVAQTDLRNYPLYNLPAITNGTIPSWASFNNSTIYGSVNLTTNLINRAGYAGSTKANQKLIYASTVLLANSFSELTNASRQYPDFLFNANYQDLVAISSLGGAVTFSLNDGVANTTFLAANFNVIQSTYLGSTYTLYEAFNTNIVKTSNTFSRFGAQVSTLYTLLTPTYVSTTNNVTVNPFVGPFGYSTVTTSTSQNFYAGTDKSVKVNITGIGLSNAGEAVSSMIFYNVINEPIVSQSTAGMLITGQVGAAGTTYLYTVSTLAFAGVQVFTF